MNNRQKKELDNYVNEIFKRSSSMGRTVGMSDFVDQMGECELTERHLPDHLLEIFFGEQLLSPGKITSMTAVDIKSVFSKHNSEITALTNKWLGKQEIDTTTDPKTKIIKKTRNSLKPEIADIIRKRLSQIINLTTIVFAKAICDQILIVTEFVEKMIRAAGYLFGFGVSGETKTKQIAITEELTKCYEKVAFTYYEDPRLNYKRTSLDLRPVDFLFFVNTSAGISTNQTVHVKLTRVLQDIKILRKKVEDVKRISETEKMFEDFFVAAFSLPGQDIKALAQSCSEAIASATQKLSEAKGTDAMSEIKTELIRDFVLKANSSAKNMYDLLRRLTPPPADLQKMQDELNAIISETNSI